MPSATTDRKRSPSSNSIERFPDLEDFPSSYGEFLQTDHSQSKISARTPSPGKANVRTYGDVWQPHKNSRIEWGNGHVSIAEPRVQGRQKSLSDAIRTIRTRKGSVSQNAHELADALKAPLSFRLMVFNDLGEWVRTMLTNPPESLPYLVYELRVDEHVFQIHS